MKAGMVMAAFFSGWFIQMAVTAERSVDAGGCYTVGLLLAGLACVFSDAKET